MRAGQQEVNDTMTDLEINILNCIEKAYTDIKRNSETLGELKKNIEKLIVTIRFRNQCLSDVIKEKMGEMVRNEESSLPLK